MTVTKASLRATLSTTEAARLLGVSRVGLWKQVRDDCPPVPVIRVGRAIRWPSRRLLDALGLDEAEAVRLLDTDTDDDASD